MSTSCGCCTRAINSIYRYLLNDAKSPQEEVITQFATGLLKGLCYNGCAELFIGPWQPDLYVSGMVNAHLLSEKSKADKSLAAARKTGYVFSSVIIVCLISSFYDTAWKINAAGWFLAGELVYILARSLDTKRVIPIRS